MDDTTNKLAALERELTELGQRVHDLAERFGNGEATVRGDLNTAIGRRRTVADELYQLKSSLGLLRPEPEVLYGPPPRFRGSNRPNGNDDE